MNRIFEVFILICDFWHSTWLFDLTWKITLRYNCWSVIFAVVFPKRITEICRFAARGDVDLATLIILVTYNQFQLKLFEKNHESEYFITETDDSWV